MNQKQTILIVDDDPDILRILKFLLSSAGYQVVPGYGGEDALRKLKKQHFDLVLTDLAMPKFSGIDLIEHVRQDPDTARIPIIAVTAFVWDSMGRSAADLGCDAFIQKPFEKKNLLETVQKFLPRH